MALIQFGTIITDMRGKIAGSVFSNTPAGPCMRNKVAPPKSRTATQSRQRAVMSFLANEWKKLSNAQRLGWNNYALNFSWLNKLGNPFPGTGWNAYFLSNSNLILAGRPVIADAPIFTNMPQPAFTFNTLSAAPSNIMLDITAAGPDNRVFAFFAPQVSRPGVTKFERNFKYGRLYATAPLPVTINATADYVKLFGELTPGNYLSVGLCTFDRTSGNASDIVWIKQQIS